MGQVNRISKAGLELVKSFEGLRKRSEPLSDGGWIVGYGHTRSAREGVEVTEREAEYLLRYDLQDVEEFVSHHVHAPLNQNEFDALVSFCWNVGREAFSRSDVLNYINAGEMLAAAESFSAWRKARVAGRLIVVDALVRRRTAEKNLFLSHPSGPPSAPSRVVRPELDVAASVLALSDGALSIEAKMNDPDRSNVTPVLPGIVANDQFQGAEVRNYTVETETGEVGEVSDVDTGLDEPDTGDDDAELNLLDPSNLTTDPMDVSEDELDAAEYDLSDYEEIDEDDDDVDLEISDQDDSEDDLQDDLSRAMAAASLAEVRGAYVSSDIEDEDADEDATDGELVVLEDDDQDAEDSVDAVEVETDLPPLEEADHVETETESETDDVEEAVEDEPFTEEQGEEGPDQVEPLVSSLDISEGEDYTESEETVWYGEPEEAFETEGEAQDEPVDEAAQPRRVVIDDIEYPNGMTIEEAEALEAANGMPMSGQRKSGNGLVAILPFLLLAIIGLVMAVIGILDWWNLVQSDTPINENELYAGPFLTLIGGFGLVFGLYFMIRKLIVKDS